MGGIAAMARQWGRISKVAESGLYEEEQDESIGGNVGSKRVWHAL